MSIAPSPLGSALPAGSLDTGNALAADPLGAALTARPTADTPTPRLLTAVARRFAARPDLWRPRVRFTSPERFYARLEHTEEYEVWLLTWLPGQRTEIHGHGGSSGAFSVVQGALTERAFPRTSLPVHPPRLTLASGDTRAFGPRHVHEVGNDGEVPAVSVHAYSPALTTMSYFRQLPDGRLVADRVEGVDR
jgi:predicted metal-dependent enzyme (double-stranded beta helix superfamily)